MENIDALIWAALEDSTLTIDTDPVLALVKPFDKIPAPVDTELPVPYLLLTDMRDEPQRKGLKDQTLWTGTFVLNLTWPVAVAFTYTALRFLAGRVALSYPVDKKFVRDDGGWVRVAKQVDVADTYMSGAYLYTPVRVSWRTD